MLWIMAIANTTRLTGSGSARVRLVWEALDMRSRELIYYFRKFPFDSHSTGEKCDSSLEIYVQRNRRAFVLSERMVEGLSDRGAAVLVTGAMVTVLSLLVSAGSAGRRHPSPPPAHGRHTSPLLPQQRPSCGRMRVACRARVFLGFP